MRSAIVGFVVGVAWLQTRAVLPQYLTFILLVAIAVLAGIFVRNISSQYFRMPVLAATGALLGFVWAGLFAQVYLMRELPKELEGQDFTIVGTIDSMPSYFERGVRFNFAVEKVLSTAAAKSDIPAKLALSWYSSFNADEVQPVAEVHAGERWQFTVRLRRPHGNANPHGFDYELWLLEQNIRATGYIRPNQSTTLKNQRLDDFVFSFNNVVERSRGWLRTRVQDALRERPYAGVIVALVVGDQRAVSQADWDVFMRTGVGHLISISGLHITMIAALFAGLVLALWRRSFFTSARLPLLLPAQKAAALAGVLSAAIYVLLAGSGVPAQRTLMMITVVAIALWCGRLTSVSHVLCLALATVVVLDPWAVLGPGFWLSFSAVAVILYVSVGRAGAAGRLQQAGWRGALKSATLTQYAVTLGLVPLTILLFGQTSLVSPLANAIAIPLISFLVTPLALVGSVLPAPLSAWCLGLAHFLVAELAQVLSWLSAFPLAVWMAPIPEWWMFVFALVGTLWMLAPRGWPARYLGLFAWLPLILNTPTHPRAGEMWLTAFDVGQGMALLIETEHHRLLYDTGPAYASESDGGNRVILPYLRARGINKLEGMMISHSDMDHAGGAMSILNETRVGWISSSLPDNHPIVQSGTLHRRCAAGQAWHWDGVDFEILHPTAGSYDSEKWKPNARSCTLKVTQNKHSILLPGDIESVQEAELVEGQAERLAADVLLAPHHGSGTSSTLPFLRAVDPQIALFQVGYRNRYRHPKKEIFERYGELGITRLRNDEVGAISMRFGSAMEVSEYRSAHARYWYGR
jgi:competence protein ComEC